MRALYTRREFEQELVAMVTRKSKTFEGCLEVYLRGLWGCLLERKDERPTLTSIAELLERAFSVTPMPFDPKWQKVKKLPWNEVDGVYVIEGMDGMDIVYVERNVSDWTILENTILVQIADLHCFRHHFDDPLRTMGLVSASGGSWYNFDVDVFLTIGTRSEVGDTRWLDEVDPKIDWTFLAAFLEVGQGLE